MKALELAEGRLAVREIPSPEPGVGEALVRIRLAGICGTDLALTDGYADFEGIPGHEFVGVVVSGYQLAPGTRVVCAINIACGRCTSCSLGHTTHCLNRQVVGIRNRQGAFAEYIVVPETNLLEIPDNVTDEQAVLCEPLAAALEIGEQVSLERFERALVIGAGRLGLLVAGVLSDRLQTDVVNRSAWRRPLFRTMQARLLDQPDGRYDLVVEVTGAPTGFSMALDAVRARGTLVLKSTYRNDVTTPLSEIVVNEVTLVGSRCGPMDKALDLLASSPPWLARLSSRTYSLEEASAAFETARTGMVYKVFLNPVTG